MEEEKTDITYKKEYEDLSIYFSFKFDYETHNTLIALFYKLGVSDNELYSLDVIFSDCKGFHHFYNSLYTINVFVGEENLYIFIKPKDRLYHEELIFALKEYFNY